MKKQALIFIALFLLLSSICHAEDDLWFYRSSYLTLDSRITTDFDIVGSSNSMIDYVALNLSFFPRQTNSQAILNAEYTPTPEKAEDVLMFRWKSPPMGKEHVMIDSKVKIINSPSKLPKKVNFPIDEDQIPEEYIVYTEPTDIIDMNSRIISLASELASGEDDLFVVVDKIATWVNTNIRYNLSTVTSEASQKSTWVIENREGVCDELTSLFISMLRSLNIPARFVSGVSYTNLEIFKNKWGAHGWAEVFFPGYGWIPFDVTYGEYGWVDPTHIISNIAVDAGKFTSRYSWRAEQGVSLNTGSLNTDVELLEKGPVRRPLVSLSTSVLKNNAGFGSYNLVTAKVKNLEDFYQSLDVYLSQTSRLANIDGNKRHVVLRPKEEKTLYWIVKVDDSLDRSYMYTFPVAAYTLDNASSRAEFIAVDDAESYSLDVINRTVMQDKVEDRLVYSRMVKLNCSADKEEYYEYEKPFISCMIKNTGNVFLKDTRVCLGDDCVTKRIGITEKKDINFTVREKELGENEIKITADDIDVSKVDYVRFDVIDRPEISIEDVEYPSNVSYKEDYMLRFMLKKKSVSGPQDIDVDVKINRGTRKFHFDSMDKDIPMEMDFRGKDLTIGENEISVTANYKDKNGKEYSAEESFTTNLSNVTLFQKMMIFLRTLF